MQGRVVDTLLTNGRIRCSDREQFSKAFFAGLTRRDAVLGALVPDGWRRTEVKNGFTIVTGEVHVTGTAPLMDPVLSRTALTIASRTRRGTHPIRICRNIIIYVKLCYRWILVKKCIIVVFFQYSCSRYARVCNYWMPSSELIIWNTFLMSFIIFGYK